MTVTRIWLSPDTAGKSRYAYRMTASVVGIALLSVLLICGGNFLILWLELPKKILSLLLCLMVTALTTALALRTGQRALQDASAFFLTEDGHLFLFDARELVAYRKGIPGYVEMAAEVQRLLQKLGQERKLPSGSREILSVTSLRERRTDYVFRCVLRFPDGHTGRKTCFLVKGYEEEELLLHYLELRKSTRPVLEPRKNRNLIYGLWCLLPLGVFWVLCILSHPALSMLPAVLYFPCLGAAFVSVFFVIYFLILYRRGE